MHFSSVESDSEGLLLPVCSISVKVARNKDDSSRSTHSNSCMVSCKLFISLAGQTLAMDHNNSCECQGGDSESPGSGEGKGQDDDSDGNDGCDQVCYTDILSSSCFSPLAGFTLSPS